jgi:hypothetical protein
MYMDLTFRDGYYIKFCMKLIATVWNDNNYRCQNHFCWNLVTA